MHIDLDRELSHAATRSTPADAPSTHRQALQNDRRASMNNTCASRRSHHQRPLRTDEQENSMIVITSTNGLLHAASRATQRGYGPSQLAGATVIGLVESRHRLWALRSLDTVQSHSGLPRTCSLDLVARSGRGTAFRAIGGCVGDSLAIEFLPRNTSLPQPVDACISVTTNTEAFEPSLRPVLTAMLAGALRHIRCQASICNRSQIRRSVVGILDLADHRQPGHGHARETHTATGNTLASPRTGALTGCRCSVLVCRRIGRLSTQRPRERRRGPLRGGRLRAARGSRRFHRSRTADRRTLPSRSGS